MRVLLVHNFYQQPGGEDQVFASEGRLLESYGHTVRRFTVHNDQVKRMNRWTVAAATVWNGAVRARLAALVEEFRPQVVHFHNTFPLISPAGYYAARQGGAAVVQTLHNYRLICPGALLFRAGRVCEDCVGRVAAWPAAVHACYRQSRPASGVVAAMLAAHRAIRTWDKAVDLYLSCSQFARDTFVRAGWPASRIVAKPNFLDTDPGPGAGAGGYALFVGRLAEEKGVRVMVEAWRRVGRRLPLRIVGDGPLAPLMSDLPEGVSWLGRRRPEEVLALLRDAAMLIFPSVWYEGMPRTIIEALACGTPVVASRLGAMLDMVEPGRTGEHFEAGDAEGLARRVLALCETPVALAAMRPCALDAFERNYTAEKNHAALMSCYERSLAHRAAPAEVASLPVLGGSS